VLLPVTSPCLICLHSAGRKGKAVIVGRQGSNPEGKAGKQGRHQASKPGKEATSEWRGKQANEQKDR